MASSLALLIWFVLLVALLRFDPAKHPDTSIALWVPVIWLFIVASRMPSAWLGGDDQGMTAFQAYQEGSSLDRTIWSLLIVLALGILISRSFAWKAFFANNLALVGFLAFALLSMLWSDFPLITLKRWLRDMGDFLVILVILSDSRPLEAIRTVLRRLCYLLVPLSIVLIKYFGDLGKQYSPWTGHADYVGVATAKNQLGALCLVSGIFLFWDTLTRWSDRKERRTKQIILVNLAVLAMTFWLMHLAGSATSNVCFGLGCLILFLAYSGVGKRHSNFVKFLAPTIFFSYLIVAFFFDMNSQLVQAVGRDPSLTDRTRIWHLVLSLHTNPVVGTGYQSFWLGYRLQWLWQHPVARVNQAHNGYLETYLELGFIGVFLICSFLISSYRTICKRLEAFPLLGSFSVALWLMILFYNVTEASFEGGILWLIFLMGAIVVPEPESVQETKDLPAFDSSPRLGWPVPKGYLPRQASSKEAASPAPTLQPAANHWRAKIPLKAEAHSTNVETRSGSGMSKWRR